MDKFRELLEETSCEKSNGAVQKKLRSIIDHNPNVFMSALTPKVVGMFNFVVSISKTVLLAQSECILYRE